MQNKCVFFTHLYNLECDGSLKLLKWVLCLERPFIDDRIFPRTFPTHCGGVHSQGIREYTCNGYSLMRCQILCTASKEFLRGSLHTVDTPTRFSYIEVHLHNSLFAPKEFDEQSVIRLKTFSPPTSSTKGKTVFGHLLADSTAPSDFLSLILMLISHLDDLLDIKTGVLHETAILGSDNGPDHNRRYLSDIDPRIHIFVPLDTDILETSL